ncbi:uncharacterized protein JN550_013509 [Neoarthrinium moseri]|uniref:uncharacterized protein n=1 Tax=Neoarthrinium moseri TaxID=1658444 RepID=UPI001FDE9CDB|nr:uncharacterized protein JN550_013509 [Neoarthrinium moseri]KAI1857016.1 hypothetical protein JN550_013509 [Neoarthrinium moseri]
MSATNVNAQGGSPLFTKLPQELRNAIYASFFSSTRLTHGRKYKISCDDDCFARPSANSLALLRTCRRASSEIGSTWVGQVLFYFLDIHTMMAKLTTAPHSMLSQIRLLRVDQTWVPYYIPQAENLFLRSFLDLLPGLSLQLLIVKGDAILRSWLAIEDLMEHGSGWTELNVHFPTSVLSPLYRNHSRHGYKIRTIPAELQQDPETSESTSSSLTVELFRSKRTGSSGAVFNEDLREPASVTFDCSQYSGRVSSPGDRFIHRKELLLAVRRPRGVDSTVEQRVVSREMVRVHKLGSRNPDWKKNRHGSGGTVGRADSYYEQVQDQYDNVHEFRGPF